MNTFEVYPTMTLAHLQRQFREQFSRLRIEPVGTNAPSAEREAQQTLAQLSGHPSCWCFLVEGDMDVAELRSNFQQCLGLTVRVECWTGHAWHDTNDTRHWTLNQLNQQGVEFGEVSPNR